MPEPNDKHELNDDTEIRNQRKILEEAIRNPKNEFPELSEQHQQVAESLQELVTETDKFYTKDEHGNYPRLDQEAQQRMISVYQKAIDAVYDYQTGMKKIKFKTRDMREKAVALYGLFDKVNALMGRDFKVLLSATRHGIKTLPEVIRYARTNRVDLGNQRTAKAGANMSSRIRMKIPDEKGNMTEGFFTPASGKLPGEEAEMQKAYEKLKKRTDKIVTEEGLLVLKERIRRNLNERKFNISKMRNLSRILYTGVKKGGKNYPPDKILLDYLRPVMRDTDPLAIDDGVEIPSNIFDGTGVAQMLGDYFLECYTIKNKYGILRQSVQMDSFANIEQRNSAMSDVAQLLGMGDLIAYAEPMTIIQGGEEIRGIFMEKAKGEDISLPSMGSVFANPDAVLDVDQPELKEQIADLQILDYICGNIDRHAGNMVYQFKEKEPGHLVCTGIQGIDNDASFGKIWDGNNRLPGIFDLEVISERTAFIVNNLSPAVLKTTLRNYNFSKQEMNAAIDRVDNIKKAIRNGKIKVVKKEEWKNLDTSEMQEGYFETVRYMASSSSARLQGAFQKESQKNYKKHFTEFYRLKKPLEMLNRVVKDADKNVWNGSKEFDNVRKYCRQMMNDYQKVLSEPSADNLAKMRKTMEETMKNAQAYKALKAGKKLNDKEKKRLEAVEKVLNAGEAEFGSVVMLEKCCMQQEQADKMEKKSFDALTEEYLSAMRENIKKYPVGTEKRKQGENALEAVKNLADMAKTDLIANVDTQRKVAKNIMAVINYDPELMNKTELTYAYGSFGDHGRKRALESAMDIVTFLNDVYISEKAKTLVAEVRAEKEVQSVKREVSKEKQVNVPGK